MQELLDELVHVADCVLTAGKPPPNLAVVIVERLEVLVDICGTSGEAKIERAEYAHILVILILDELDDNLLLRLWRQGGGRAPGHQAEAEHGTSERADGRRRGEGEGAWIPPESATSSGSAG